jgi:anti-anti-sigma regulatory factor
VTRATAAAAAPTSLTLISSKFNPPGRQGLTVTIKGSIVFAAGELTGSTVDLLLGAASHLVSPDRAEVTLDLGAVTRVDPRAAQALLAAQHDWSPRHTRLRLRVPQALRTALAMWDIAPPASTACPTPAAESHPPRQQRNQRRDQPLLSVPTPTPAETAAALASRAGPFPRQNKQVQGRRPTRSEHDAGGGS